MTHVRMRRQNHEEAASQGIYSVTFVRCITTRRGSSELCLGSWANDPCLQAHMQGAGAGADLHIAIVVMAVILQDRVKGDWTRHHSPCAVCIAAQRFKPGILSKAVVAWVPSHQQSAGCACRYDHAI